MNSTEIKIISKQFHPKPENEDKKHWEIPILNNFNHHFYLIFLSYILCKSIERRSFKFFIQQV